MEFQVPVSLPFSERNDLNCSVFTDFETQHWLFFKFSASGLFLKYFSKFRKFHPLYSDKIYSYRKRKRPNFFFYFGFTDNKQYYYWIRFLWDPVRSVSISFLVHGSVRDFLRYLSPPSSKLSLLPEKVCTEFYLFEKHYHGYSFSSPLPTITP